MTHTPSLPRPRHARAARLTFLLPLALALLPALPAVAKAPAPAARVVLPAAVEPERYRIAITPEAQDYTFSGVVDIDLDIRQATSSITLNSLDIVIDKAALSETTGAPRVSYDAKAQTARLDFASRLAPGKRSLHLEYHGRIYEQASGLFALDYDTPKGKARALFTQFENADARRFVPCWDEPGRKAVFELTATVPVGQMAVSNMPAVSTDALEGDLQRVHFAPTPRMSTYLLFFALGDFERVHREVDGVDLGIIVKRGDTANAAYALDVASATLPYYNDYFGVRYPLPKLDIIGGPGSSQYFGAMENWGAIFSFENDLLIDPRVSTEGSRRRVYIVTVHEMAHQWFGDLVTMDWWDDLWLNEGFASWMEGKAMRQTHPEWKPELDALGDKQRAMRLDGSEGTHPVITPITDVLQAQGAFDAIAYQKGAAVIRTLESYVGEDAFRAGVRRYMKAHAFGNTVTDDLWKAMDEGSANPITQIAHDLTQQAGVPLVSSSASCQDGKTRLQLAQGRFVNDGSTLPGSWHVPVRVRALEGGATEALVVSGGKPASAALAGCGPYLLNAGQGAYFRSQYPDADFSALAGRYASLEPADQLGLLNDTASLGYAGLVPMDRLLDLASHFPKDADPLVADALVDELNGLDLVYKDLPGQAAYRRTAQSLLQPQLERVGWEHRIGEDENLALLRESVLITLGRLGDAGVIARANSLFDGYLANPASLDAAQRQVVLAIVARHADAARWEQLHQLARTATSQIERRELYIFLGAAQDEALAQRTLELALSGEPATTVAPNMIAAVARDHPALALEFAIARWSRIEPIVDAPARPAFVPDLITRAVDTRIIDTLEAYAKLHIPADMRLSLRKAEAGVRSRVRVRTQRVPQIDAWIKAHAG